MWLSSWLNPSVVVVIEVIFSVHPRRLLTNGSDQYCAISHTTVAQSSVHID